MSALSILEDQLAHLQLLIVGQEKRQEIAGNRWQANHDDAHREHKAQKAAERAYHRYNLEGHTRAAQGELLKAGRCKHRAIMAHRRAVHFIDAAKDAANRLAKLKISAGHHEDQIHRIEREQGARRVGPNKVRGGTHAQMFELTMHLSMLHGSKFYSQVGPTDVYHCITGPSSGHRHDCSSWFTSVYYTCGFRNPNRSAGSKVYDNSETMYTGTLGEHGEAINESELDWGCAILFGYAPFHHVEMKYQPMSQSNLTVGHGDSQINYGNTTLLPGPRAFRRYVKL